MIRLDENSSMQSYAKYDGLTIERNEKSSSKMDLSNSHKLDRNRKGSTSSIRISRGKVHWINCQFFECMFNILIPF